MSSSLLRRLYAAFLLLLIAGCSGGGCSSCAGGAIQPIHGGFPLSPDRRIPHAVQVRLTDQGLRTVEAIAPSLFAGFIQNGVPVGMSDGGGTGYHYIICPSGNCRLNVSLPTTPKPLELSFVPSDKIQAIVRVIVQGNIPIHACAGGCSSSCGGFFCAEGDLTAVVDTTQGSYRHVGLWTDVVIARDTHAERLSYHRADFVSATGSGAAIQQAPGEGIEDADIDCQGDNTIGSVVCFAVNNFLKGTIIDQFSAQIGSALGPIQDALAASATPDPPGCPTGTTVTSDGKHCLYPDNTEVPTLLGTDGTGDLGALVSSFTPGVHAPNSFVVAAGDPTANAEVMDPSGMSVDVFGAFVSSRHSVCVPRVATPAMPTIPEWANLRQNNVPGTTTPVDLGIGVAEDFLNSTFWNLWDSGLFCLAFSTRTSQQLAAGTFTALPQLASLKKVLFPATTSPVALVLRPQIAPTVTIGSGSDVNTDPLMTIRFTSLAIDFYAWSEERYVRFMTVTTDLTVPVNLQQDTGGLKPVLGNVTTANTVATNTQLLTGQPDQIAMVLDGILGIAVGMFAGNLPTIAIPSIPIPGSMGPAGTVNITIPDNGIQGLNESGSRYLGLFADMTFTPAGTMPSMLMLETAAPRVERLAFNSRVYEFAPGTRMDMLPRFRLHMAAASTFARETEYSYRVDDMTWSRWSADANPVISSPAFIAQGRHHVDVRARMAGVPESADREPARVEFVIDTLAPALRVDQLGEELHIAATDEVSDVHQLVYNVAFDGQQNDAWTRTARVQIPDGAQHYVVRVRDESGNEATTEGEVQKLIRGGPSTDNTSGCGCSTPGTGRGNGTALAAFLGTLAGILLLARRRSDRARRAPVLARRDGLGPRRAARRHYGPYLFLMIPVFFVALGCNCGSNNQGDGGIDGHVTTDGGRDAGRDAPTEVAMTCGDGMTYCASMNVCTPTLNSCTRFTCPVGQEPTGNPSLDNTTCMFTCMCRPLPPLQPGMVGSHLDMAVHTDNTIWLSAYSAGDPAGNKPYGDLIVGKFNRSTNMIDWVHVDGVPANGMVTGALDGWRGGISTPGDDVGRWNSIALDSTGKPRVSYWDTTHDNLKFAWFDGTNWHVSAVDTAGHNGRYTSLVILPNGHPAIAYRATANSTTVPGGIEARVRYAVASSATPSAATDWTLSDVTTAATQCRAADCASGQQCIQTTGTCVTPTSDCSSACAAGEACVAGTCAKTYTSTWIEDMPPGIGLFNSLALDASGNPQLVFYSRDRGNLLGTSLTGSTWATPFIIDGERADGSDIADRGLWSSLTVAPDGTWHVAYVDGWDENVMYVTVSGGTIGTPEIVDDGTGVNETPFDDGKHIVGDSAAVNVDASGTVRIVYQDSTAGTLRLAQRDTGGAWTLSTLDTMGNTGYWARIERGNAATFWRDMQAPRGMQYGVRIQQVR